jgi:hypothetical protein
MRLRGTVFAVMVGAGALTVGLWGIAGAADPAPADSTKAPAAAAAHQYVGVKKCKMCHNSEKSGAQYAKWLASKHAKAYETLGGDTAKMIAKKRSIEDPQKSADCLQCHQTGYGEPADHFAATYVATDGVQCETCHGAGKDYAPMKVMQGIRDGSLKGADYGLVMPTQDRCAHCHNDKSPTFVAMNFASDSTKISHPIPPGYKRGGGEEEKAK